MTPAVLNEPVANGPVKESPLDPAAKSAPQGLTRKTAGGFFWLAGQTLGNKAVNLLSQIALTWLLAPDDFGLVAVALTVAAFVSVIQQMGLKEILTQRQRRFALWANAAFWMTLAIGLATALLMAAAAPVAARVYADVRLIGLLLVLSSAAPLAALSAVSLARLQIEMRFGWIAWLGFGANTLTALLSISFALLGFGAYSFVLPKPIVALAQALLLWFVAAPPTRWRLHLRRWRYLVNDSALLLGTSVLYTVTALGDYAILGMTQSKHAVGLYYFAFNIAVQTVTLFATNLSGVLMPAFSRLQDDLKRQLDAFLRSSRLLAAIGVPIALMQAAVAGPLVRLLFGVKWLEAIPLVFVLSLGMAIVIASAPAGALLLATRRFRLLFWLSAGSAMGFCTIVGTCAAYGGVLTVAVGVAVYYGVVGPVNMFVAIRPLGGSWRQIARLFLHTFVPAGLATLIGYLLSIRLWQATPNDLGEMVTTLGFSSALYLALLRFWLPRVWAETESEHRRILGRPGTRPLSLGGGQ
jgi:PST family polysaccharide transporter